MIEDFWGACGIYQCDECYPFYDKDNDVIPNTENGWE